MRIFSTELHDRFRRKPISTGLIAVVVVAAMMVVGEFSVGFINGMMAGFTDGV